MKIAVVASELPHPQGTAAGRDLWAWCSALGDLGHELDVWVWYRSSGSPEGPVPDWAHFEPLDIGPLWRAHLRALVKPRNEAARIAFEPDRDAVLVADHLPSVGAVLGRERSVVTMHYRALADARSVGRVRLTDVQAARAERRAGRMADLVLAYSERVGRGLAKHAHFVPMAHPVPDRPVAAVEAPVAALLADWSWPPNRVTLDRLLGLWPEVRRRVAGARLVLAGRNLPTDSLGPLAGVEVVGPVADSMEVLGRAAVVAFPCPNSSGPKMKTLEALALGLPVLTTAAGMEGIAPGVTGLSSMVADDADFARRLSELLCSPEERRRLGELGRDAVAVCHSPRAAALRRVELFARYFES